MMCQPCKDATDSEVEYQAATGKPSGGVPGKTVFPHPKKCGCACQHRPVGSILFDTKKKAS